LQETEFEFQEVVKVMVQQFYKPTDFTVDFFGMKYQGNSVNLLDSNVLYFGAYEKDILFFMRDIMLSMDTPDNVFVDVGANNGHHSLYMSKYTKVVHAFEPYPRVLETFHSMVALNKIENIIIHPVGLGDKEEMITFYEPPETNLGTGTFVESYLDDKTKGEQLQIVTGDVALSELGIDKIKLIKIDVEGYEKPALKGLRKTLQASRPFVVFEISIDPEIDTFFKSMDEVNAVFPEKYGFIKFVKERQRRISGNYRLVEFSHDFNNKSLVQFDLVAYPVEKLIHIRNYHEKRSNITGQ